MSTDMQLDRLRQLKLGPRNTRRPIRCWWSVCCSSTTGSWGSRPSPSPGGARVLFAFRSCFGRSARPTSTRPVSGGAATHTAIAGGTSSSATQLAPSPTGLPGTTGSPKRGSGHMDHHIIGLKHSSRRGSRFGRGQLVCAAGHGHLRHGDVARDRRTPAWAFQFVAQGGTLMVASPGALRRDPRPCVVDPRRFRRVFVRERRLS